MADPYAGMDPAFAAKVKALIQAAGGRVKIVSGHRSKERQTALWEAAKKKYGSVAKARKWVAPPGRSHHEKGQAVDFGGDLELAAQLAERVGLARPLKNEFWHYEAVGSRGKKAGQTPPPPSQPGTTTQPAPIALAPAAPPTPVAPDPEAEDRKRLDVQFATLLDFLREPEVV